MSDERFDLIFNGELVPGFELTQVKKNLQLLFRLEEAKVNALFCDKPVPLKKGVDSEAANKYRVAMKKAGARVDLVLNRPAPAPAPASRAVSPQAETSPINEKNFTTSLGAQPEVGRTPRPVINAPDFGIAAVGAELLRPEEKPSVGSVVVDTSYLSVAPQEGSLLKEGEKNLLPGIEVTIPELDLAAVGSDLLLPSERTSVEPVQVDLSGLSLAKVGERLGPPSPPTPAAPNVDHITLQN